MIIHQPEIKKQGNEVVVSARVETNTNTPLPKELWFKFPIEYQDAVSDRAEGFFTNLFLLGMHLNENIEVRGAVSPKLVANIEQYSSNYQQKYSNTLNLVDFNFKSIEDAKPSSKKNIRLAPFSAGADSFYTFWSHLFSDKSEHPTKLTHGIFIHGFDIFLKDEAYYQYYLTTYQKLFNSWGLSLISSTSNHYAFYQFRIPWAYSNAPALIGSSMVLGNQVSKFYKPGNFEPSPQKPKNMATFSYLLSTETLDVSIQGGSIDRTQKLIRMFDWIPVQKHLRVCLKMEKKIGEIGCNRCTKCLSTSLFISLYNKQDKFPNTIKNFTLAKFFQFCWISNGLLPQIGMGYLKAFKEKKRYDLILIFWLMVPISYIKGLIKRNFVPLFPKHIIFAIKKVVFKSHISSESHLDEQ